MEIGCSCLLLFIYLFLYRRRLCYWWWWFLIRFTGKLTLFTYFDLGKRMWMDITKNRWNDLSGWWWRSRNKFFSNHSRRVFCGHGVYVERSCEKDACGKGFCWSREGSWGTLWGSRFSKHLSWFPAFWYSIFYYYNCYCFRSFWCISFFHMQLKMHKAISAVLYPSSFWCILHPVYRKTNLHIVFGFFPLGGVVH